MVGRSPDGLAYTSSTWTGCMMPMADQANTIAVRSIASSQKPVRNSDHGVSKPYVR